MKVGLINLILCFLISVMIAPPIIKWLRELKFGQSILVYVEQHKTKSGTPTMGGIIIVLSAIIGYVFNWDKNNILATISILSLLFFGMLGFLDDFIKIKFKHNEGLKPYQKIIGQLGIATIIAIYIYMSDLVGGSVLIPFTNRAIYLGWFIIPFVIIFYIAVVNSVNLLDGLDGLCGGVSSIVFIVFSVVLAILSSALDSVYFQELNNIIIVTLGVAGAILGSLCFNFYPARVFMGDTGSLAIGGFLASILALTREYILIFVIGAVFVVTSLSVIVQVFSFKVFKKRIFKMTPIHHHFEYYYHESKVTSVYYVVTLLLGVLTIALYI